MSRSLPRRGAALRRRTARTARSLASTLRSLTLATGAAVLTVLVAAAPAGAQQIVDAGGERGGGALAFVLLAILCLMLVGSLFYMDKVRRRASEREDRPTS